MNDSIQEQGRHWSRHARRYDEVFLDPYRPGVSNPILEALQSVPRERGRSVIDLGCGTGPLLPYLIERFDEVVALDFAPGMIRKARARLGERADRVKFLARPMDALEDFVGHFEVAVAVNSIVMPDVRVIDRTLTAIRRCLKPDGQFLGVVPAMDAIHYHTMLLHDHALDRGADEGEAERSAAFHGEHVYYDFAFGRFDYQGLKQHFWQPFEVDYRLRKAGFSHVEIAKLLYPWDEHVINEADRFSNCPPSWDWTFSARS